MKKDQFSTEAFKTLLAIEEKVIKFQPQNIGQSNTNQHILRLMTEYTEMRRSRIYSAQFALPHPV
jgi:hypothetical protein